MEAIERTQSPPVSADLVEQFAVAGPFVSVERYGSGHIHDTYRVTCAGPVGRIHYLLQRINHTIFQDPVRLMENIRRVTAHLRTKLAADDVASRVLTIIPTRAGADVLRDTDGGWWRMYVFLEHTRACDRAASERQVCEAARAFGRFQRLLADLPAPRLHETIPFFHHAPRRLAALRAAIREDPLRRAAGVQAELEFVERRAAQCDRLQARCQRGELPERITHNDTKLNNILFDERTQDAVCVIDLDTVMPGLALYDFGDLVRTATAAAPEDEGELSRVHARLDLFAALARGYLAEAGFLTDAERAELVFAGRLVTLVIGMRFLTDYLRGDVYFHIHRPLHNLDRCRAQFAMVASLEAQAAAMERIVAEAWQASRHAAHGDRL